RRGVRKTLVRAASETVRNRPVLPESARASVHLGRSARRTKRSDWGAFDSSGSVLLPARSCLRMTIRAARVALNSIMCDEHFSQLFPAFRCSWQVKLLRERGEVLFAFGRLP